jgi:hypothetical protein
MGLPGGIGAGAAEAPDIFNSFGRDTLESARVRRDED